jgi:hypothetical protein
MQGQFEQQLNGYQLSQLGYGACTDTATVAVVTDFLQRLPDYERRLAEYRAGDNSEIKRKLDQLLADDVALARQFHRARA